MHANGDRTGAEVVRLLVTRVQAERASAYSSMRARSSFIVENGSCYGARVSYDGRAGGDHRRRDRARDGRMWTALPVHDESDGRTGDGYALAHRAGAELTDMEFIQFHPTALDTPESPLALVSEAVRGEGAVLLERAGRALHAARAALAELAPRDVVARAVLRAQAGTGQVCLDARKLGERFATRFPGIFAVCMARGIDPRRRSDPGHARRALHDGRRRHRPRGPLHRCRLCACGEVACTGVHGANRLASNSLLEGLVFAERVARDCSTAKPSTPFRRAGVERAVACRSRRRAGRGGQDSRADVGARGHRANERRDFATCLAALDEMIATASGRRDRRERTWRTRRG